jgi:hypothetical protein
MFDRFQILLQKNWGMPYHYIIAFHLVYGLGHILNPAWVCAGVILLATGYEIYQFKKKQNNPFDFATDMIANLLGIGAGAWLS